MDKEPKLMSLSRMHSIFAPHLAQLRESIFINNELAVLHGDSRVFRIVMQQQPPFSINDHRLGMLVGGEIRASINLVDYTNGQLNALNDWTFFDLSSMGEVEKVYFTLNSTDVGAYGMNTAAYFCMDKFQVNDTPTAVESINTGKQVVSVKYVNLAGVESATPFQGLNIEVKTYSDGTHISAKVLR